MILGALIRLEAALRAAGIPIDGVSGSQADGVRVDYQPAATPGQRTQGSGIVSAFDWSAAADLTFGAQQEKAAAAIQIDRGALQAGQASERVIRSVVLMVLDEFNTHSTLEAGLLAAIAAATTLADLKTRAASLVPVPQRTAAQLVAAIKAKIAATAE